MLRVRDARGRRKLVAAPFSAKAAALHTTLAKAGWLDMLSGAELSGAERTMLLADCRSEKPRRHVQIVSTPGWAKPGVFVTLWRTYA